MKRFFALFLCFVAVLALSACGGSNMSGAGKDEASYAPNDPGWYDGDMAEMPSGNVSQSKPNTKMIYTASIDMETTEFDKAMSDLNALVDEASGYFEERSISGFSSDYRYASLIVRVPSAKFDSFCTKVGDVCRLIRLSTSQENVSESYYDIESRLNTARTKLARLQELLAKAERLEDIITLESAISETEQEIDRYSGNLRNYDNLVDYATVSISVREVYRISEGGDAPQTLGDRMANAFRSGLQGVGDFFEAVAVFFAYAWLWLIILAAVVLFIIWIFRRCSAGKKKRVRKQKGLQEDINSRPE